MGPRPEDRGEPCHRGNLHASWTGFNGATARRPWRVPPPPPPPSWRRCFNGATARRPWRARCWMSRGTRSEGFNGATARRPWRGRGGPVVVVDRQRFNGATARRPWRGGRCSPGHAAKCCWLQWGHGPKTVESRRGDCGADLVDHASLGPRPEDRGEKDGDQGPRTGTGGSFNGATARRPWRGCESRPAASSASGFNGATARRPWRGRPKKARLSCSRRGFNGATARRPWRDPPADPRLDRGLASMGPRPEDRGERRLRSRDMATCVRLQWGHGPKTVERGWRR